MVRIGAMISGVVFDFAGALAGSVVANLIVWASLEALLDIPATFLPFDAIPIAMFTALGTIGATLVYWLVRRTSATPDRTFTIIAIVVLVLSIIPNLLAALNPEGSVFPIPGVTATGMLVLIVFHIVAAVIDVWALTS